MLYEADGSLRHDLEAGGTGVYTLAFSPSGKRLATASGRARRLRIWDVQTGELIAERNDLANAPRGTGAIVLDDDRVAHVGNRRVARLGRISTDEELTIEFETPSKWCAFMDDGRYCGSPEGLAELDVIDGDRVGPADEPDDTLLASWPGN